AQISVTERRAMKAERETTDRLIAHFLADKVGAGVVDVRLVEAAPVAGALRFELLSEGQAIPRDRKRDGKRAERRAAGFGKGPGKGSGKKAHKERKTRSKKDRMPAKPKSGKSKRGKSWT
ncbi:MAG: ribonuclease R, partial [Bradyrhizobium sp.]